MVCNTTNGNGNLQDVTQLLERNGTMLIRAQRISIHIMWGNVSLKSAKQSLFIKQC
jgi:hypothetical protein